MKTLDAEDDFNDTTKYCKWIPTSRKLLAEAEKSILDCVKTPYVGKYVTVSHASGKKESDCQIWTLAFNETSKNTPIVLLHGFASGVALWSLNFDALAKNHPVYAIDFLGFGKSSRPKFNKDGQVAEKEIIQSVEEWRKQMDLENFVLVGHSMGGFLSSSYALSYPERVKHLILADPWGFPEKPADYSSRRQIPFWVKAIAYVMEPLNPLWGIRFAGPYGPGLIEKFRSDLVNKFSSLSEGSSEEETTTKVASYIYHCNAQSPTGESAFHSMMSSYGWAKFPMEDRISELHKDVPLTAIYGASSWVDSTKEEKLREKRGKDAYVNVEILNAGHHVYADDKERFHDVILKACDMVEKH